MKLGFFHYGSSDKTAPVSALEASITRQAAKEPIGESLIVLPEAFNIEKPYYDPNVTPNTDGEIVGLLQALARKFHIAFVAGLVLKNDARSTYSGAYLVTRHECTALSYKRTEDDSAHFPSPNYEKYPGEWHYPVTCSDACVGALVYADATPFVPRAIIEVRERQHFIRSRMAGPIRILCVPVCMSKHYSPKGIADECLMRTWSSRTVTQQVAGATWSCEGSVSTQRQGKKTSSSCCRLVRRRDWEPGTLCVRGFTSARVAGTRRPKGYGIA